MQHTAAIMLHSGCPSITEPDTRRERLKTKQSKNNTCVLCSYYTSNGYYKSWTHYITSRHKWSVKQHHLQPLELKLHLEENNLLKDNSLKPVIIFIFVPNLNQNCFFSSVFFLNSYPTYLLPEDDCIDQ